MAEAINPDREYWSTFEDQLQYIPHGTAPFMVVPVDVFMRSTMLQRLQKKGLRNQRSAVQNLVWLPESVELAASSGFMQFAAYGAIPGYVDAVSGLVKGVEVEFNKSLPRVSVLGLGSTKISTAEEQAARKIVGYTNALKMMLANSKHAGWDAILKA